MLLAVSQKDGGTLTTFMQAHKSGSVVLLDEVEKAHPEVLDLFLPCFGEYVCVRACVRVCVVCVCGVCGVCVCGGGGGTLPHSSRQTAQHSAGNSTARRS